MPKRNWSTITIALLGAAKLILDAFGIHLLSAQLVNQLANGVSAVMTIAGVMMTHLRRPSAAKR